MLKFILYLAIIGAIIGLLTSRGGMEGEDTLRGALCGAKLGCGCLLAWILLLLGAIGAIILIALAF